jgi:SAM-dependent methyltransferase
MGCGLVQLMHSYNQSELYGDHYGYRSSLNASMVQHLQLKAASLDAIALPQTGDVVLDIGSNDGTFLGCYPRRGQSFVGFDPCASQFAYRSDIAAVPKFFSATEYDTVTGGQKARIITSIAMFYDLEQPLDFVRQVADTLADDGIWHLEQSYLPAMLEACAYDTICHEHLEYYGLRQIKWMAEQADLKILQVARNDVNGGSFALTLSKQLAPYPQETTEIMEMLKYEEDLGLDTLAPYRTFRERVMRHRDDLISAVTQVRHSGLMLLGYGASTKGNVLLQYCNLTSKDLLAIAEVNEDKFGCYTPGTKIPIISEAEARRMRPDVFLVLPWHFRRNIVSREQAFLAGGGTLLFPLPQVERFTA